MNTIRVVTNPSRHSCKHTSDGALKSALQHNDPNSYAWSCVQTTREGGTPRFAQYMGIGGFA
jgi:hypothetical protein